MVATWQQVLWVPFRWIWQPGWLECSSQIDNLYLAITTFPYWNDIFHTLQQEFCSKFSPGPAHCWPTHFTTTDLMQLVSLQKSLHWQICQKTNKTISGLHFDIFWHLGDKKIHHKRKSNTMFFFSGDSKWTSLSWMKFFQNWNFGTTVLNGLMESTTIRSPCWSAVAPGLELGDTIPF